MKLMVNRLKEWCLEETETCMQELGGVVTGTMGDYAFKDNGASVLAVAHLDIATHKTFFNRTNKDMAFSPSLDDRLGAYIICDLLPSLGIKLDILLTEGEESGMSTAGDFKTDKQYNWIVEFDRRGTDVVMYDYDQETGWDDFWKQYGTHLGIGSFTDICSMEHLGRKAFNIGTGYYNQHTMKCHVKFRDVCNQVKMFMKMYEANKDVVMEHEYKPKQYKFRGYGGVSSLGNYGRGGWQDDEYLAQMYGYGGGEDSYSFHDNYYKNKGWKSKYEDKTIDEILEENSVSEESQYMIGLESEWYYDAYLDEWVRMHFTEKMSEDIFTEKEYEDADTAIKNGLNPAKYSYHTRRLIQRIINNDIGKGKNDVKQRIQEALAKRDGVVQEPVISEAFPGKNWYPCIICDKVLLPKPNSMCVNCSNISADSVQETENAMKLLKEFNDNDEIDQSEDPEELRFI